MIGGLTPTQIALGFVAAVGLCAWLVEVVVERFRRRRDRRRRMSDPWDR
jgi:hypothetical protein